MRGSETSQVDPRFWNIVLAAYSTARFRPAAKAPSSWASTASKQGAREHGTPESDADLELSVAQGLDFLLDLGAPVFDDSERRVGLAWDIVEEVWGKIDCADPRVPRILRRQVLAIRLQEQAMEQ